MQSKHTAGSWMVKNGTYPADIIDDDGKLIAMLCERDSGDDNTDEQDANAALIAAAPAMFKAFIALAEIAWSGTREDVEKIAKDAIAAATENAKPG